MNESLRRYCLNRLGFDPAELTEAELSARTLEIEQALFADCKLCREALTALASNQLELALSLIGAN